MIVVNETGAGGESAGNSYFTKPADLAPVTKARSVDINNLAAAVESAFGKIPDSMAMKTGTLNYAADTGTLPNTYEVAIDPAITSYTDGLVVRMRPTRANTGACSINVNGMGAVAIKRVDGNDLQADDIGANLPVSLNYVAASNTFVSSIVVTSQVKQAATQAAAATASAEAAAQLAGAASASATASATSAGLAAAALGAMGKDANNGTAGLSGYSINLKNAAGSIASKLSSIATAVRTWTFPDKSGTVALTSDLFGGFSNIIINGDMRIAQRALPISSGYTLDRWVINWTAAAVSVSQSNIASLPGESGSMALRVDGSVGNTGHNVVQRIESANCRFLLGSTCTLSFWYYNGTGASKTIFGALHSANALDNFSATTQFARSAGTVCPNGAWTQVPLVASIPAGAANGIMAVLGDGHGAMTSGFAMYGNAQLAPGDSTLFERRPIGFELFLCMRYYQYFPSTFGAWITSTTAFSCAVNWPVPMRAPPSALVVGTPVVEEHGIAYRNVSAVTGLGALGMIGAMTTVPCNAVGKLGSFAGATAASGLHLSAEVF